ncbi:MAG: MBL fold metallo-hydrolase [Tepidisphaeraceae bacterium]|jgi:metallo-beta-lactamase family protein
MHIQFCGADRTVTGSSHLLQINGLTILLDMGMYQGPRQEADRVNRWLAPQAPHSDVVILSHGHLDHCGKLPVLTRAGFAKKIYCTPATAEITRIVLEDSAAIQMENIQHLERQEERPGDFAVGPLYEPRDIPGVLKLIQTVPYAQKVDLGKGVQFAFYDAGHIIGSAFVVVEWSHNGTDRRLVFTGDVGRYDTPIIRDPQVIPGPADYLITESTYGNTKHAPMSGVEPQFFDAVQFCIQHKSRLLVPSFAVGRTQSVLWYIQKFIEEKRIPEIPIFVDSPMGTAISQVHMKYRDSYDDQTLAEIGTRDLFGLSRVTFASSVDDSKKINSQAGTCVIIASSPTCEFGRIVHHLNLSLDRPNDLITFVGYIPPGTLGSQLQSGLKHVRMLDQMRDVKCQIRTIHGLSAHADADELMRFLGPALNSKTSAWVVHGEVDQSEPFADRLSAAGVGRVGVPARDTTVNLAE